MHFPLLREQDHLEFVVEEVKRHPVSVVVAAAVDVAVAEVVEFDEIFVVVVLQVVHPQLYFHPTDPVSLIDYIEPISKHFLHDCQDLNMRNVTSPSYN